MSDQHTIPYSPVSQKLLWLNVAVTGLYLVWWLQFDQAKNIFLFSLLLLGEIYHVVMALTFWYTVRKPHHRTPPLWSLFNFQPTVDVFIPVTHEPIEIIEATVNAALAMTYTRKKIWILNDGYVAGYEDWQDAEKLAEKYGVGCITRKRKGGAKAGNINYALKKTRGEIVVIFDADMQAKPHFLTTTLPYFQDPQVGFVQTPQYYSNQNQNSITAAAWDQQSLFFGPILRGKDTHNSAFICGTNVAIRRTALEAAGGMREDNIAEDFLTSLTIHRQGWKSIYHPEVLASGLAPLTLGAYFQQQMRWARGSLEVLFRDNPLLHSGLSWAQKTEYLASALYYLNGLIIFLDMIVPVFFLFFGMEPISSSIGEFSFLFLPFIVLNFLTLHIVTQRTLSFRALAFAQSSWVLQIMALFAVLRGQASSFKVTPKQAEEGNFLRLAVPHIGYIAVVIAGVFIAINRDGFSPAVAANTSWVLFNSILFLPYIWAAYPWSRFFEQTLLIAEEPVISSE